MKIAWFAPEVGNFSSGIVNHTRIFVNYLRSQPDVEEVVIVKYPVPEYGVLPPLMEEIQGIRYYTPRISMEYQDAIKSILQAELKFTERLKVRFLKFLLKLKGIKRLDLEKIKKWGQVEFGLFAMASVQLPFPNPFQKQIGRCIARLHPDIIQSHMELFSVASSLAKESAKAHLSYQVLVEEEKEAMPPRSIERAFWTRMENALRWLIENETVDLYIAASEFVEKRLQERGIQPRQIKVVHSPIVIKQLAPIPKSEARSRLGIPQNKRVILSIGRLLERKRFIDIIQILKDLPEDVIFYLKQSVCTSDSVFPSGLAQIQKYMRKYKLENRVIINSEVMPYEKMHEIYSAADVAVYPFLYEPFGMCAAEAMATGRPLVVYNSGYLPNFIKGNGFIVDPMNLDQLSEKIKILLNDPALAEEMGSKGPALVKQFDIQVLGEKLLNIYREFL